MTVVDRSIVEENKTTTWHSEPLSFARSERRCVRLIQHQCDDSFVKKRNSWLRNANGERVTHAFGEAVIVIGEVWNMSTSQQEAMA